MEPLLYIDQPEFEKPSANMQEEYQTAQTEKHEPDKKAERAKSDSHMAFKERSNEDKIRYLLHLPREMPAIRCEVSTEESKHRGIMKEDLGDQVVLRVYGRQDAIIYKEDITSIRLLGF